MQYASQDAIPLLTRTPAALNALLRDLPPSWTLSLEGEGTWTVREVIVHLIEAERTNWIVRARHIFQHGETQPFAPFQRVAEVDTTTHQSLEHLLDEFARLRLSNIHQLTELSLTPADLDRSGIHPAFGKVTLAQLLATWTAHDLSHLHQIARILAHQYREAVGPWSQYLGVLHCTGHSAS